MNNYRYKEIDNLYMRDAEKEVNYMESHKIVDNRKRKHRTAIWVKLIAGNAKSTEEVDTGTRL